MKIQQVLETYDEAYAEAYDQAFLLEAWSKESVAFQLELLGELLEGARHWLDVGCGTGWVLSQFPHLQRTGLDISPAMLAAARERNPDVTFVEGNFRDSYPEWEGKWDVVSCMWWAYCLAESMEEIRQLVANLARWTSGQGSCFLPLCNPQKFDTENIRIPYIDPKAHGRTMITGITWTYIDPNGKRHDEVVSPQTEHMVAMFEEHFDAVQVIEGQLDRIGEGWRVQDVLIAKGKKERPKSGYLYSTDEAGEQPGQREWRLHTAAGNTATTAYPSRGVRHVRLVVESIAEGAAPWDVQLNRIGHEINAGVSYRLSFRARADAPRPIAFGVARDGHPWDGLGLHGEVALTTTWRCFESEFDAAVSANARVHFDLAQSLVPVELTDIELVEVPAES